MTRKTEKNRDKSCAIVICVPLNKVYVCVRERTTRFCSKYGDDDHASVAYAKGGGGASQVKGAN